MQAEDFPIPLRIEAEHVFRCSEFVTESFARDSELWADFTRSGALEKKRDAEHCWPQGARPEHNATEADVMRWLRLWRRREMVRIAWRDLSGRASLEETLADLSSFADDAIHEAMGCARRTLESRFGQALDERGEPIPLVVVGMGKLGGGELNFSSDIDLVFLFPTHGETQHERSISHEEFFVRLGQALLRLLAAPTVDGFVFRVDMRLRPFGDSGPIACSFSAFEDYLLQHGRDWERYAWIKARAITGSDYYATLYQECVRPFVYRRYLDFGVFDSLRDMKQMIELQVARKEWVDHLKLGPGGIREIEFIVQAMQLIRGGQDRRLQSPKLMNILPRLARSRLLSAEVANRLLESYRYLRTIENRLQMLRDAQTHSLPTDEPAQRRLVYAMAESDWSGLRVSLDRELAYVQSQFQALVFTPIDEPDEAMTEQVATGSFWQMMWDESLQADRFAALLAERGGQEPVAIARLLMDFRDSGPVRRLERVAAQRLQRLLPALLGRLTPEDEQLVLIRRLLRVLESIGGRSAYFALLNENPVACHHLLSVCRAGDFLVAQLAAHPLLLDELLDERTLNDVPGREALSADLEDRLARVVDAEPEHLVEALAQFKHAAVFRVAIADLAGNLPVMRVSDRLTDIAELIITQAMHQAWTQMTTKFGVPQCRDTPESDLREVKICALGYGKLGGWELGYGSDLDLVFLHDSTGSAQETTGVQPVDNQVFFVRLAQRIVHILTVHSAAGRLYEVDVRLRPSGKGGMLITQIEAFADYQRQEAWTWEHQALLHARAVAGDRSLCQRFEQLRVEILTEHVRRAQLKSDVRAMRERMRRELSRAKAGEFDLKQDVGGMADIEFLAQYWALREAASHSAVVMFSDTIRQLETLASGNLVSQQTVDQLTSAYRSYRSRGHLHSLRDETPVVPGSEFIAERAAVKSIWDTCFDDPNAEL
jgi:glutamate-ammonia-ligase adenylyltransferase